MSEFGLDYVLHIVEYNAPFGPDTLRAVFAAIRDAVADNWRVHRDRLSKPEPYRPVDVERWLLDLRVSPFSGLVAEPTDSASGKRIDYQDFPFSFSPVSFW